MCKPFADRIFMSLRDLALCVGRLPSKSVARVMLLELNRLPMNFGQRPNAAAKLLRWVG
jgi:hypothetical protein